MSLFGDLDLKNAPDDPNAAPLGAWEGTLTEVSTFNGVSDPNARYMKFVWVHDQGLGKWEDVLQLPDGRDETKDINRRSRIKQRLLWMEVTEDQMDDSQPDKLITPEQLVGTRAKLVTKKNGNFVNLSSLKLNYDAGDSTSADYAPSEADNYDYMGVFNNQEAPVGN